MMAMVATMAMMVATMAMVAIMATLMATMAMVTTMAMLMARRKEARDGKIRFR